MQKREEIKNKERDKLIIYLYHREKKSLQQIGNQFGISRERVRQIMETVGSSRDRTRTTKNYRKKGNKYARKCAFCSGKFEPYLDTQRFCSPECTQSYYNQKKPISRWQVFNRDNFRCQYCGRNPTQHRVELVIDHIKPIVNGGKDKLDNYVTACKDCNSAKCDRPLRHEAKFKKRLQGHNSFLIPQMVFNFYLRSLKRQK